MFGDTYRGWSPYLKEAVRQSRLHSSRPTTSWYTESTVFRMRPSIFWNSHSLTGSSTQLFSRKSLFSDGLKEPVPTAVCLSISEVAQSPVELLKLADLRKRKVEGVF